MRGTVILDLSKNAATTETTTGTMDEVWSTYCFDGLGSDDLHGCGLRGLSLGCRKETRKALIRLLPDAALGSRR